MKKQVFILGAGFSVAAGLPSQYDLTKEIFEPQKSDSEAYDLTLYNLYETQRQLLRFLETEFGITSDSEYLLQLEDIYTPLDRSIVENSTFRTFPPEELLNLRQSLDAILILALKAKSTLSKKPEYIEKFAQYIIDKSRIRANNYRKNDPVSVITTNWDILLDNAFRKQLLDEKKPKGVIDYNCYVSSLKNDPTITPGLKALAEGKFIVKLLKIHGSINWLHCPKCQRIYIDFYQRVIDYGVFRHKACRYCSREHISNEYKPPLLRTMLLMPTFIKDLSNFQTKLIWRNSGVEISEADELVFIGYSFPMADFEFRQLLFRNVKRNAKIRVVLYDRENPDKVIVPKDGTKVSYESAAYRYLSFFGGMDLKISFEGVKDYIENLK
jgi:NAD-dependent SIR2 family protein deacetylase